MSIDASSEDLSSTEAPASASPVSPKTSWTKRALIVGVGLLIIGAASFALQRSGEAAPETMPASDVPRVLGDQIHYSDAFARRAGIKLDPVKVDRLVPAVAAVGTVDFNAEHVAAIGTRLRGLVSRVTKFEGDSVEAGAVLARVESAELGEAQATVSMLDAERHAAELNAEREAKLAERSLTTAREVEMAAVEAKKASLLLGAAQQKVAALGGSARTKGEGVLGVHDVRSPIKGTVVERNVAPGQFVEGQLVAFKVANLDHLWIELDVFERNLSRINVGDRAELKPLASNSEKLVGRVAKVASRIDSETHSAKVRIEVENYDRKLRVGQAVQATIHSSGGAAQPRIVAPTSAVTFVDGKPTVFVAAGANAVRVVNVELGASDADETEILSGLKETDRIVTDGAFALKSELFR
ncbi:MAG TPA: efflux RND transporter periplasmic adaptor subunit [Polyangiaceae bacterium]|nr:efflux RND transporter periplasmic adaptor subunit [Polyangiaceae bacterium]